VGAALAREGVSVSGVDAEQRKAGLDRMRAYLPALLPPLRLQQWDVEILDDAPDGDDVSASIHYNDSDWSAVIKLADPFLAGTRELQRLHMAHELMHLYLRGLHIQQKALITAFSTREWQLIDSRFEHEMELTTDSLAYLVAPTLPLPPEA